MQCPKCGNTNLQIITETETKGKDLEIGVNPKYFLDALKVIEVQFCLAGLVYFAERVAKEKEPILQVIGYVLIADTGLKHEQR